MKTNEELNALRSEVETLNKKLAELTEEELAQVAGGVFSYRPRPIPIFDQSAGESRKPHPKPGIQPVVVDSVGDTPKPGL